MQADAFNADSNAALLKLCRAISRPDCSQIREEWPALRPSLEDLGHLGAEPDKWRLDAGAARFQLLPGVANRVARPIDILSREERGIALRCACVPKQLVEVAALGIGLFGDYRGVLGRRDPSLILEDRLGPFQARDH